MNLKYYLRGLGIGIVVTALIMGIVSGAGKKAPSDAEVRERAKALGMVEESTLLADAAAAGEKEAQEKPTQEAVAKPTETPASEPVEEPAEAPTSEPTVEPTAEPDSEPAKLSGKEVTIAVNKGEGSYTICKRLEDAGLIASASAFDHYLCENGYDRRMRVGSFQIPADADPEQIAGILAGL